MIRPLHGGRRRRLLPVLVGMAVLLAGGCRMDAEVALDVEPDGSGEVEVAVILDEEAVRAVGDVAAQLRLDDLAGAGWAVEGPERQTDGSTLIAASKPFTTPEQAVDVLGEVAGSGGPIGDLRVERRQSFLSTKFEFSGQFDLTAGIDAFSDDELRQRLAGSGFGLGSVELEQATGAAVDETFGIEFRAELPGGPSAGEAATGTPEVTEEAVVWRPEIGEVTTLAATSRMVHTERLVWLGLALASALSVVAILVRRALRRQHSA